MSPCGIEGVKTPRHLVPVALWNIALPAGGSRTRSIRGRKSTNFLVTIRLSVRKFFEHSRKLALYITVIFGLALKNRKAFLELYFHVLRNIRMTCSCNFMCGENSPNGLF